MVASQYGYGNFKPGFMIAVIECPDGRTYEQIYDGTPEGLKELKESIGEVYWIVDIYE